MASQLFEEYDPYGIIRRRAEASGDRRATIADLLPEEQKQGLLRSLAASGMSGVSALGWLLDTPGAVIRGTLEGGPLKGLSALLPSAERVSGRDLMRQYGLVGESDTWGNFGAGLAAEVALDPLTYLTLGVNQVIGRGVPTASGALAKKLGLWSHVDAAAAAAGVGPRRYARTRSVNDLWDALPKAARAVDPGGLGLRALEDANKAAATLGISVKQLTEEMPLTKSHGWSIPFAGSGAFDMFGGAAGDFLADAGDRLGKLVSENPVAARLTPLFSAKVLEQVNPERWGDARRLYADRQFGIPEMVAPLQAKVYDANEFLKGGIEYGNGRKITRESQSFKRAFRNAMAGILDYTKLDDAEELEALRTLLSPGADNPVRKLVDFWASERGKYIQLRKQLGLPVGEWMSRSGIGDYFPAEKVWFQQKLEPQWPDGVDAPTKEMRQIRLRGEQAAPLSDRATVSRAMYLDLPAREELLAAMTLDADLAERLRAAPDSDAPRILRDWAYDNYPELMQDYQDKMLARAKMSLDDVGDVEFDPERFDDIDEQSQIVDRMGGLFGWLYSDPRFRRKTLPDTHPLNQRLKAQEQALIDAYRNRKRYSQGTPEWGVAQRGAIAAKKLLDETRKEILTQAMPVMENKLYAQLADTIRYADPQHAATGIPLFGGDPINDLLGYARNNAETSINADFVAGLLGRHAQEIAADQVPGGTSYSLLEAGKKLGMDPDIAGPVIARKVQEALKVARLPSAEDIAGKYSVSKSLVDDWAARVAPGRVPEAVSPLVESFDEYTKAFKTLALLWPSRYVRDRYSGAFSSLTQGLYSRQARAIGRDIHRGDYKRLGDALDKLDTPGYRGLNRQQRIRKFLVDAGAQGLAIGSENDVLRSPAAAAAMRAPYPGATPSPQAPILEQIFGRLPEAQPGETVLGRVGRAIMPPAIAGEGLLDRLRRGALYGQNPVVRYGEDWAGYTDAINRYGAYAKAILDGFSPTEAKRLADLTQVNYAPEAFTAFERNYMRRLMPFYSYTRGIAPLIAENAMAAPSARRFGRDGTMDPLAAFGVNPQNIAVRYLSLASKPSDENFVPEHLRQSASIPLPAGLPLVGLPSGSPLQRYITNIDLPFQQPLDLLSIGVGNSPWQVMSSTLAKTGSNILGQTHPIPKTLLEWIANRQFYSGRQLSDLYSMLEQQIGAPGRGLEQATYGLVPGGARALGLIRQIADDRLTVPERLSKLAIGTLTGARATDIDQERARQFAARDVLNELLTSSKDVRTYENISVRDEDLAKMPDEEKRLYLLYKVLQSESAKRARERKKAQTLLSGQVRAPA